jgi:hypothetical protein
MDSPGFFIWRCYLFNIGYAKLPRLLECMVISAIKRDFSQTLLKTLEKNELCSYHTRLGPGRYFFHKDSGLPD